MTSAKENEYRGEILTKLLVIGVQEHFQVSRFTSNHDFSEVFLTVDLVCLLKSWNFIFQMKWFKAAGFDECMFIDFSLQSKYGADYDARIDDFQLQFSN